MRVVDRILGWLLVLLGCVLIASVWTGARARAERFAAALDCGTVYQNRCDYLDPALP